MLHQHHTHCAHQALKFCERCDVTYCTACSAEWKKPSAFQPYWWYGQQSYSIPAVDSGWTSSAGDATAGTVGSSHSHS